MTHLSNEDRNYIYDSVRTFVRNAYGTLSWSYLIYFTTDKGRDFFFDKFDHDTNLTEYMGKDDIVTYINGIIRDNTDTIVNVAIDTYHQLNDYRR